MKKEPCPVMNPSPSGQYSFSFVVFVAPYKPLIMVCDSSEMCMQKHKHKPISFTIPEIFDPSRSPHPQSLQGRSLLDNQAHNTKKPSCGIESQPSYEMCIGKMRYNKAK
jgi:hypothetical protein